MQLTSAPDRPVTIFFSDDNPTHRQFFLYTLVTFDGVNFEGPFQQTTRNRGVPPERRSIRSGPGGAIFAIWFLVWPHTVRCRWSTRSPATMA